MVSAQSVKYNYCVRKFGFSGWMEKEGVVDALRVNSA